MSALLIRQARQEDLSALIALLADDEKSSGGDDPSLPLDPRYQAAFEAIEKNADQMLIAAERAGRLVGMMQLSFLPGLSFHGSWRGHIEAVRVASDLRGQGIGAEMMSWAIERCRERGCRMVQFMSKTSRTDAHRFYRRLGFEQTHAGFKLRLEREEVG